MAIPFQSPADRMATDRFFERRPDAWRTFTRLADYMTSLGPLAVTATKSRVAFLARTRFLWIPQARVDGGLVVRFLLPHPVDSPRVRNDATDARWSCRVTVHDLDAETKAWFAEAYAWDRA